MSELLLFNANSVIFQLYYGVNKLIFNEMMMRSILYKTNTLSWIFIVLAHSPQIDMSSHSDTLSWFWANQSFSLCCVLSGEATHSNIIVFGLTRSGLEPPSTAFQVSTLTITSSMQLPFFDIIIILTWPPSFAL